MKPDRSSRKERIVHILEAVELIEDFTTGYSYNDFKKDPKAYFACLYQFAVIGEAIMYIGDTIMEKYDYPWYKVRSFRNFLMHEYHAVDEQIVWDTIQVVLPEFKKIMVRILRNEYDDR